ncbi:alanine--tRNA ligase, partial [Streptomyces sp. SID2955]|nr:alanine--tRNA ligase [Streptomyces sp. SID2955]
DTDGVLLVTAATDGDADAARALATAVRELLPAGRPGVVAVGAESGGKGVLVATVNPAATGSGLDAARLVRQLLNGRGGGTAELAQGGGLSADRLRDVLRSVPGALADR